MNLFQDIPVLRSRFLWFALAPGGAAVAACIIIYTRAESHRALIPTAACFVAVLCWCVWFWRRLRQRARDTLVKTRGLTCLQCGYSLVGVGDGGDCPECGRPFYADHLTRCWSNAAGFP